MLDAWRKLLVLLSPRERRLGAGVLAMMVIVAFFELAGVASILPFIAVVAAPSMIEENVYLSRAYDWLGVTSANDFMLLLGLGMLFMLLSSLAFRSLGLWVRIRYTHGCTHTIGCTLLSKYLAQPYPWYFERHSARLGNTIQGEVAQTINGVLSPLLRIISNSLLTIALLTLLIIVEPVIALSAGALMAAAYGTIFMSVRPILTRIGTHLRVAHGTRARVTKEVFGAIKDVKTNGLEQNFLRLYEAPSSRAARLQAKQILLSQMPSFAMQGLIYGGILSVILYLLSAYGSIESMLPTIAIYAFAAYRLMPALQSLYSDFANLRTNLPMLESVHRDYHNLSKSGLVSKEPSPLGITECLELSGITYSYPNAANPALASLNLKVPARHTIGLVGTTGAGKTTAVDLILGLLEPTDGSMLVDGQDLWATGRIRAWQRTLGYVPQHIYLNDDSIAANIALGVPMDEIDQEALERAARTANIHDFIVNELEEGYDTPLGEWGVRLSGGQRQRVGIARALYHDPPVIVMDEATSALDNVTERVVMEAVQKLGAQKTIILIAHRLTTVQNCDRIFLLENGRIAASGTYNELVEENVHFREMARASDEDAAQESPTLEYPTNATRSA